MINFVTLWNAHSGFSDLCDFSNQCAIRMGDALKKSKVNMSSFKGVQCWEKEHKNSRHILRAQELADWMLTEPNYFGYVDVKKDVEFSDYSRKQGIVFIKDGWGVTDHIDVWNGTSMKSGYKNYFEKGQEVWFWSLP